MVDNKRTLPFVSALIVTYNEEKFIKESLSSLINQTYPCDRYEIIIIDGNSSDNTINVVDSLVKEHPDHEIKTIYNPKKLLAAGWNLGIKAASGEYVVRIDAHSVAKKDFIEKSVDTILRIPDVACVGGKLTTAASQNSNKAVSLVLSSPFGVGNSSFRVSNSPGYADTAVYGLYKKEIFEEVGYFNEFYARNQDIELHARIKKAGGKFYFNPEIESTYYARNSVKKMAKQAFGNGKWNMILILNRTSAPSIRHLIPFAFVFFLFASTILGFFSHWIWKFEVAIMILHLFCGLFAAFKKTRNLKEIVVMPFLFLILHISYGLGYFSGIKRK